MLARGHAKAIERPPVETSHDAYRVIRAHAKRLRRRAKHASAEVAAKMLAEADELAELCAQFEESR